MFGLSSKLSRYPKSIALALYLLAATVRLWGIAAAPVQPDELHWRERSREILVRAEAGSFSSLTSHVGQPGIVPALFMAVGQAIIPPFTGFDQLEASRTVNAVVSSLIAPLIFLGGRVLFGEWEALLAAFLMLVDPIHIGLSQQAHLDSILTVLVTCAILLYGHGQRRRWPILVLGAGISWGLAVATKPTAAALVPAFLIYRLVRKLRYREEDFPLLSWLDVWAIIVGHVTFACIYTRFWEHPSQYQWRLKINIALADWLYSFGSELGLPRWELLPLAGLGAFLGIMILLEWRRWSKLFFHLYMLGFTAAVILLLLGLFPAVFENIARFWGWTAGLSAEHHRSYGILEEAPRWGYAGLFLSRLPTLVLAGAALSVVALRKTLQEHDEEIVPFTVLILAALGVWVGLLSVSPKQTFRYVMPVIPGLMLLSAFGLCWIMRVVASFAPRLGSVCAIFLVLAPVRTMLAQRPNYLLYYNAPSGGISGAKERNSAIAFAGLEQATAFLIEEAKKESRPLDLSVFGDGELFRYVHDKLLPDTKIRSLNIQYGVFPVPGSYVLRFGPFLHEPLPAGIPPHKALFVYEVEGVRLVEVLHFPSTDYGAPFDIPVASGHRLTGARRRIALPDASEILAVIGNPGEHQRGFLISGLSPGFLPGNYRIAFGVRALNTTDVPLSAAPAIRLEVGKNCQKTASVAEVIGSSGSIEVTCSFQAVAHPQIRAYWFGKLAVALDKVTISKQN